MRRSLISSSQFDFETLNALLVRGQHYRQQMDTRGAAAFNPLESPLRGKPVALLFFENSTRTRLSFDLAAKQRGLHVLDFQANTSSLNKGESLVDTLLTLEAMGVEAVVLRHGENGLHARLAEAVPGLAILNAGEGTMDHPTQGLLDLLTLYQYADESLEALKSLQLGIVGDLRHSRVAAAHGQLAQRLGHRLRFIAPPSLQMEASRIDGFPHITQSDAPLESVLPELDIIMALRLQKERLADTKTPETVEATVKALQLYEAILEEWGKPALKVMHPGPVNWGVELDAALAQPCHPRSLIHEQVRNGVAMRMACYDYCFGLL